MNKLIKLEELCTKSPFIWVDTSDILDEHSTIERYAFAVTQEGRFKNTVFTIGYYRHDEAGSVFIGYIVRHSILGTVFKGWIADSDMLELIIRQVLKMQTN